MVSRSWAACRTRASSSLTTRGGRGTTSPLAASTPTCGRASAFSTLGWFNDPLLSTTVRGDTAFLVNTVIHELSHNTLFVAGNAEFSESFANFIGARGAEAFFRSRNSPLAAQAVVDDWANDQVLGAFWEATAKSLDSAYAAWPGDSAARVVARDSVYARARRLLVDSVGPRLLRVWIHDGWSAFRSTTRLCSRGVFTPSDSTCSTRSG